MNTNSSSSSLFQSLVEKTISVDLFFDSLLCDKDLAKLICTCRRMQEIILNWKTIFPVKEVILHKKITDDMLRMLILHYSNKIIKLIIPNCPKLSILNGYDCLGLIRNSLLDLSIWKCEIYVMQKLASQHKNLTSLSVSLDFLTKEDVESISQLTNLETLKIYISSSKRTNNAWVKHYSFLKKMKRLQISCQSYNRGFSRSGFHYLVAKKNLLCELYLTGCYDYFSDGGNSCWTTLTNLTKLTVRKSMCNNIGLKMICSRCLLLEYLDIRYNPVKTENFNILISADGLNNIHLLIKLKSLYLSTVRDDWLKKLFQSSSLTHLDLGLSPDSKISNKALEELCFHLPSLKPSYCDPFKSLTFVFNSKI
jgi:hypothetical protein